MTNRSLPAAAALTVLLVAGCDETRREVAFQVPFENEMRDVFVIYPQGTSREAAIADGSALYAVEGSKRPAYCDGTMQDCTYQIRSLEDRVGEIGLD